MRNGKKNKSNYILCKKKNALNLNFVKFGNIAVGDLASYAVSRRQQYEWLMFKKYIELVKKCKIIISHTSTYPASFCPFLSASSSSGSPFMSFLPPSEGGASSSFSFSFSLTFSISFSFSFSFSVSFSGSGATGCLGFSSENCETGIHYTLSDRILIMAAKYTWKLHMLRC